MEINTATIEHGKEMISELIKHNVRHSVMVWGQPGLGKSEMIYQIGETISKLREKETGVPCVVHDVRLLLREPTDLKGLPYYNQEEKTMCWAEPTEFKKVKSGDIIFLDELSSAVPMVQAAAYQLVLEKRIGEFQLPEDVIIVAAGNRATDRGVTYDMPSPLADRFIHINIKPDLECWLDYASGAGISPAIVGFLMSHTQHFNNFEEKNMKTLKTFTTPRSWTRVNDILISGMSQESKTYAIAGIVGEGPAMELEAHMQLSMTLPPAEDVLKDRGDWKKALNALKEDDFSSIYSMLVSLCTWIADKKEGNEPEAAVKGYLANLKSLVDSDILIKGDKADEMRIAVLQMAIRRYDLVGYEDYETGSAGGGWGSYLKKFKEYMK